MYTIYIIYMWDLIAEISTCVRLSKTGATIGNDYDRYISTTEPLNINYLKHINNLNKAISDSSLCTVCYVSNTYCSSS